MMEAVNTSETPVNINHYTLQEPRRHSSPLPPRAYMQAKYNRDREKEAKINCQ
jgi:hypothetical protein